VPTSTGRNAETVRRQAVSLRRALRARLGGPPPTWSAAVDVARTKPNAAVASNG
jgi:hypothetical protein